MADDEKKRVKDEEHDHEHGEWQLSEEMSDFTHRLSEKFPELRITSGRRDGDEDSHHHTGNAIDIGREHTDVYDYLMNTQDGLSLMGEYGLGVIDETDPAMMVKTGATGPHFHIGADSYYATQANQRLNTFDEYYTFPAREGAKYKKNAEGKWTINLGDQTQGQYINLSGDYASRAAALDKMAEKVIIKPDQATAFYASNPTYDYRKSTATQGTDGSVKIDSPIPLEIITNAPEHVQHFMQDIVREKDKNDINEEKAKQSEARAKIEEAKALKNKKRNQFIQELSKMNTDGLQKEAAPSKQNTQLRYQKVEADFQDQQKLPNLPSLFTIPEMKDGGLVKYEDGGVISSYGWDYKKEGDKYLTKRVGSEDWIEAKGDALASIKQKVFNKSEYSTEQRKTDYKSMVQGMLSEGYTIDDLVKKRIGTEEGLTALLGDTSSTPTERPRTGRLPYEELGFAKVFDRYSGAMSDLFGGEVVPSEKVTNKTLNSKYAQPDITMTDWQSVPKSAVSGKQSYATKKQQDLFNKTFTVSDESSMQKAKVRVDEHIQNIKKQSKEQGKEFTDKDREKAVNDAWFSEGVMNLTQLSTKKRDAEIERLANERTPFLSKLFGEDKAANFTNYTNRLLVKEGIIDADSEEVDIKETNKVKMQGSTPDVFYEEIATVKDGLSPVESDSLVSYRNQWDNSKGFTYINTPAKGSDRKRTKTYNNVEGVGHFILDASPLSGHTYMHGNNFSFINSAIENDEYLPVYDNIPGPGGRVNMKYKKPSEMTKEELSALDKFKEYNTKAKGAGADKNSVASQYAKAIDKDRFKIVSPLRQFSFDDINFESSSRAAGFKKARVVNTNDGKPTYLLFTNSDKNAYGRFDGVTVSFIFKDEHGNTIVRDYTGPVKGINEEGKSIKEKYRLGDGDLSVGYHDVGSFSGKPKAKDGKLSVSQWDGFNNSDGTGSALIIPE